MMGGKSNKSLRRECICGLVVGRAPAWLGRGGGGRLLKPRAVGAAASPRDWGNEGCEGRMLRFVACTLEARWLRDDELCASDGVARTSLGSRMGVYF